MLQKILKKWPIIIQDDHGNKVPLTPPAAIDRKDLAGLFRSKYIGNHAGHGAELKVSSAAGVLYGLLVGIFLMVSRAVAQFALQGFNVAAVLWLAPILASVLAWPFFPFVFRDSRKKRAAELRAAYIKARHCASCDYDLSSLPDESDNCTLCPECNAAWKLPPAPAPLSHVSQSKVEDFAKRFVKEMEGAR